MKQISIRFAGPDTEFLDLLVQKIKLIFKTISILDITTNSQYTLSIIDNNKTKDYQFQTSEGLQHVFANIAGILFTNIGGTVIAIDGTSGCGKGTLAKMIANHYHGLHLDSGLLYRLIAYQLGIQEGLRPADEIIPKRLQTFVETFDPAEMMAHEDKLRTPSVDAVVSAWAMTPIVRQATFWLEMRVYSADIPYVVAEGRDMATAIFPNAQHKFFVDCPVEERARRRSLQNGKSREETQAGLAARDEADRTRGTNPLKYRPDLGVILIQNTAPVMETFQTMLDAMR